MSARRGHKKKTAMRSHAIELTGIIIAVLSTVMPAIGSEELRLTTVAPTLEPLGELHPKLRWMTQDRISTMWISGNLFDCFGFIEVPPRKGEKTKDAVLVETGLNLVKLRLGVETCS